MSDANKPKPIEYNRVERIDGKYNFLNPSEVSAQYLFRLRSDAPKMKSIGFTVKLDQADQIDYECGDEPVDVAKAIHAIYKKMIYASDLEHIPPLIEYLESMRDLDYCDYHRAQVVKLDAQIDKLEKERDDAQKAVAQWKAEKVADRVIEMIKA